jgi:hypothetical protein
LSSAIDETGIDRDFVASNLNRTVTLIGSNLAIFTFVLVFLFPRYASDQLNGVLFQVTLTTSLLAIFLFGISGVYYLEVVGVATTSIARKRILVQRADSLFVVSLMLGTTMPALILFTLGIMVVAVIATGLWALYVSFIIQQARKLRTV